MHALTTSKDKLIPIESETIKWIVDEPSRRALIDDLMVRTEFSDTSPFMDWIEEAAADPATRILGAYSTDIGQWAGFITYRPEFHIRPKKPGTASLETEISIESLYVTEQERQNGVASRLMQIAIDAVNTSIQMVRAQNPLLKLSLRITFIADCFSEQAHKIASQGLSRLCSLQLEPFDVQNQITISLEDE